MRTRALWTAGVALACTISMMGGPARAQTPAPADTTQFCSLPKGAAGMACFYSDGDRFSVADLLADGLRVGVIWELHGGPQDGRTGECQDADGADNGNTWCDYDFPEGSAHAVEFVTVARDGANGEPQAHGDPIVAYVSGR
ncbi:hypothetical protein V1L54_05235 [Streptomyces sp. TRM 70361]|uniref:hypothetical protein n=1 Tax=Streptomyces sp. TRM 70361 TaxID=3116553 RepID=UPI002E7C538B|nr:hypothetical protein [Streptomyces sp. TRM 70361]MEE1938821.1 hypothetical protein [Streptomyces sp. TRM 70361]